MISSWTLKTFKSVYERTVLPIAPLTIFAGVNSSGKSTLLQSILLIAQSLQSPVRRRAITLNGRLLRLGTYSDILSTGSDSTSIDIAFTLSALDPIRIGPHAGPSNVRLPYWRGAQDEIESISCSLTFSSNEASERKEIVQLYPSMEVSRLVVCYRDDPEAENSMQASIETKRSRHSPESQLGHLHLSRVNPDELASLEFLPTLNPVSDAITEIAGTNKTIGTSRFHFLPRALLVRYDEVAEQVRIIVQAFTNVSDPAPRRMVSDSMVADIPLEFKGIIVDCAARALGDLEDGDYRRRSAEAAMDALRDNVSPNNLHRVSLLLSVSRRTVLNQLLSEAAPKLEALISHGRRAIYKTRYQALPSRLGYASDYVSNFFSFNVKYLAPLRDEPKPVYPLSGASDPDDLGFHGEHTAAVLELNKTREINYVPTGSLQDPSINGHIEKTTLERAVLDWLVYMGVVTGVYTHDLGKLGHELKVTTAGSTPRDLTHVGVGVSQVLPIIVLCLMAEPGATLIFEQPELHLHPRVQSRLADFFLSMATLGKQCIVETHSEHLINKLRLRTAQAHGDSVAKLLAMYFVESENERTKYLPIEMNDYGTIRNWPKGFFDEGEKLAAEIIKASIAKRAREKLTK